MKQKEQKEIGIYELVKGVREDFKKIKSDREIQKDPLFTLKTIELTLNITITSAAEGGIKFFIVTADAKHEHEKLTSIKLVLEPEYESGITSFMTGSDQSKSDDDLEKTY